ncbi:MAG: DUF3343 domain-containing protein [Anaerolineae bacterium]|nr:DUF3343 domain-containing protein [Anaerolineae bacterium]
MLRDKDLACKLIPVPRHISSDCGVCVRVGHQDMEAARRVVEGAGMELMGVRAA